MAVQRSSWKVRREKRPAIFIRGYPRAVIPITWRNRRSGTTKSEIRELGNCYLFICLCEWLEKYFTGRLAKTNLPCCGRLRPNVALISALTDCKSPNHFAPMAGDKKQRPGFNSRRRDRFLHAPRHLGLQDKPCGSLERPPLGGNSRHGLVWGPTNRNSRMDRPWHRLKSST